MQFVNYQIYNKNIEAREIIDYECKGNAIRFYLGKNGTQWGDDWGDPFDNAGTAYQKYWAATIDLYVGTDYTVLTPKDISYNYYSGYSKEKMMHRCFPCVVLMPDSAKDDYYEFTFDKCQGHADATRFYCGEDLQDICNMTEQADPGVTWDNFQLLDAYIKEDEIIDFSCKGNVVKLYLGKNSTQNGEYWNYKDYKSMAGPVELQYVKATTDLYIPFDATLLEPSHCYDEHDIAYSKDNMKEKKIPCLIIVPAKTYCDYYCCTDFERYRTEPTAIKLYFGDVIINELDVINTKLSSV